MSSKNIILFIAILALVFVVGTNVAFAVSWFPIVQCGHKSVADGGTSGYPPEYYQPCGKCDLFKLGRNVMDAIVIGIMPPVAVVMFVYAGFLILVSGAMPSQLTKGKSIFTATAAGIAVMLIAWIGVNFFLKSFAVGDISDNWFTITCTETVYAPQPPTPPGQPPGQPPASDCPVEEPATWSGQDPYGVDWSGAKPELRKALDLFNSRVGKNQVIISVWRPQEYQDHIRTGYDAWQFVNGKSVVVNDSSCGNNGQTLTPPEGWQKCGDLKAKLVAEAIMHAFLTIRPACTSDHIKGIAIDIQPPAITGNIYTDWINGAYTAPEDFRLCHYIPGDQPHFGLAKYLPPNTQCLVP